MAGGAAASFAVIGLGAGAGLGAAALGFSCATGLLVAIFAGAAAFFIGVVLAAWVFLPGLAALCLLGDLGGACFTATVMALACVRVGLAADGRAAPAFFFFATLPADAFILNTS